MSTEFYTDPGIPWSEFLAKAGPRITLQEPPFQLGKHYGNMYVMDHRLMRVEGIERSLWAYIESRDRRKTRIGMTGFERFGSQNIQILKVVEEVFGVTVYDEYGLTLQETSG